MACRIATSLKPLGTVKDGTRCSLNQSILDVCVEGQCRVGEKKYWFVLFSKRIERLFYFNSLKSHFKISSTNRKHNKVLQIKALLNIFTLNGKFP